MARADQHSDKAKNRHADDLAALLRAVLEAPGITDPTTRAAAHQNAGLPPPLGQFVAKIDGESYRITDENIQALLAAGYLPDAIFEMTVAAALGAAMRRLEAGLAVVREAR